LSFAVNDVLFFAPADVTKRDSALLSAEVHLPIYKMQRRDAMRLKILHEHKASITIDGKAYIPYDLSATGLSFVIMPNEVALFPLRRMLQSCRLIFAGLEAFVNLEVMSMARLKRDNERLLKVGMRFMGLSPAFEQKLAKEAYLYTHKIWSRRI
jgi:c-di-GMP-binding flagellar brake protein YcgR